MATIIRPETGETWDKVFPDAYDDSEGETIEGEEGRALLARLGRSPKWYQLSNILYVLAAYFSRGRVQIKAKDRPRVWAMNLIVTSMVNDGFSEYDSDKDMASLGRSVFWIVKVLDTNPSTTRTFRSVNVEIGEPHGPDVTV